MNDIFKLKNQIKQYEWGSPEWIPQLLGRENKEGTPWAELWMGVHPEGASETEYEGKNISLSELIHQNPGLYLGAAVHQRFGALPFLFKLLAAAKPLSIQVHPSLSQAQEGWARENKMNIPLKAPNRNYKDANHKPEILCAISPFKAMCGFRNEEETLKRLTIFSLSAPNLLKTALERLNYTLSNDSVDGKYKTFLKALFGFSFAERQALTGYIQKQGISLIKEFPEFADEWRLSSYFAELYPDDPGIIAPLYLNLINLQPGEAIYLPAGVLHAYVTGFGVELMANSDNVLRGGLTSKHIDIEELVKILDCAPFNPKILKPQNLCYPTPCKEFSLFIMESRGESLPFQESGPCIVIVTKGNLTIVNHGKENLVLNQGESAFIPARDNPQDISFSGNYTLYGAGVGDGS